MGTAISFFLSVWCISEAFRNLKRSLIIFLISALVAPYIIVGHLYIRIELLVTPVLFLVLVLRRSSEKITIPPVIAPLLFLWAYTLAITLLASVLGINATPAWMNVYSYLKPALLIILFANVGFERKDLIVMLRIFALSAIPLGLFAVAQTFGIGAATHLTLDFYVSPERIVVERLINEIGFILRAVAVFEHPSYAAAYFLIALASAIFLLLELRTTVEDTPQRPLPLLVALVASFFGGVATLSGTFIAGLSLILLLLFLRLQWRNKLRAMTISGILLALIVGYLMVLGEEDEYASIANNITYQVRRVVSLELFETRYAKNIGYLEGTIRKIEENPLFGYGWVRDRDVFVGDSMYLVLWYQSGILGLALFFYWVLFLYHSVARDRIIRENIIYWIFVLLVAGMGSPSFFIPRLNDWWWAFCGIAVTLARSAPAEGHP